MARLRVLCAIPNHPFQPGDVVDADQLDLPHARVAHGFCEWVDPPQPERTGRQPAPETTTAGPPEAAARRTRRPAARTRTTPAKPKATPKADPKATPKADGKPSKTKDEE